MLVFGGALVALVSCALPWAYAGEDNVPLFGLEGLGGFDLAEGRIVWTLALSAIVLGLFAIGTNSRSIARKLSIAVLSLSIACFVVGIWVIVGIEARALSEDAVVRLGGFIEFAEEYGQTKKEVKDEIVAGRDTGAVRFGAIGPFISGALMTAGSVLGLWGRRGR